MLSQELVKRGHHITVITTNRGKSDKTRACVEWMNGIKVVRFQEKEHFLEAPLVPQIAFRVLWEDYDLLHVHGITPFISDLAIFFGKLKRKPVVVTYHYDAETPLFGSFGFVVARLYNQIVSILLKLADGLVATTKNYAETSPVLNKLNKLPNRVQIIPLGISKNKFNLSLKKNPKTDCQKKKTNSHMILFVGQLKEHKGVRYLLKAMLILKTQIPEIRLTIVGDGPQRESLANYTSELGIDDIVYFAGNVTENDLPKYYATADLVAFTSYTRRDAFGLVLLEAMAAEKPIVASDIPGVREVVDSAGVLVPPQDPAKLAKAITEVFSNNYSVEQMRLNARKNLQSYSWEHVVKSYEQLYARVLGRNNRQRSARTISSAPKP